MAFKQSLQPMPSQVYDKLPRDHPDIHYLIRNYSNFMVVLVNLSMHSLRQVLLLIRISYLFFLFTKSPNVVWLTDIQTTRAPGVARRLGRCGCRPRMSRAVGRLSSGHHYQENAEIAIERNLSRRDALSLSNIFTLAPCFFHPYPPLFPHPRLRGITQSRYHDDTYCQINVRPSAF